MPCYDSMDADYDAKDTKRRLDQTTRLLCYVLRRCAATNQWPWNDTLSPDYVDGDTGLQAEVDQWWEEHKELDKGR